MEPTLYFHNMCLFLSCGQEAEASKVRIVDVGCRRGVCTVAVNYTAGAFAEDSIKTLAADGRDCCEGMS